MELTEVNKPASEAELPPPQPLDTTTNHYQETAGCNAGADGLFHSGYGWHQVHVLLPKVERIPSRMFWWLLAWIAVPTFLYLLLFTRMGYGLVVYSMIEQYLEPYAFVLAGVVVAYFTILYLTDIMPTLHPSHIFVWSKILWRWQQGALLAGCLGVALVVLSLSGDYSYGPIVLFTVATAAWMVLVWYWQQPKDAEGTSVVSARVFIGWCSGPFLCLSIMVFVAWLGWTLVFSAEQQGESGSSGWNANEIFQVAAEAKASACDPNFDDNPQCQSNDQYGDVCFTLDYEKQKLEFPNNCDESCASMVYNNCLNPFILWIGPFLVSLCLLFLSFMATFLRVTTHKQQQQQQLANSLPAAEDSSTPTSPPTLASQTSQQLPIATQVDDVVRFAKGWVILLFGLWVSASLAGAGAGLSTALTAMTMAAFVASAIFVAFSFNALERKQHVQGLKATLEAKEQENATVFDAIKGLLVLTCSPLALLYLALAMLKQKIRTTCRINNNDPLKDNGTHGGWLTLEAQRLVDWVSGWERRTRIFTYAVFWGVAFVVMNVIVAQFTLLFLSWLIEQTSNMELGIVTAILMAVGIIMFLLPPVPGVPIYLTLGIVIIPVGRETMGVMGSIAYAMVVCTFVKLLACTLQQKMIGGLLQHHVGVRQFVGVNSKVIRSMRLILAEPGLGIAKVAILIGGPDWPTSVLCGIMDLSLIPILVGTLPIVFLIFPTLLTGCFTYMASLQDNGEAEFPWAETMATVCAAMTGLVQFGSMVVAAYFLEQTVSQRGAELEAMPFDEEVRIADEQLEEAKKAYEKVTEWNVVPAWAKGVLSASLTCIIASVYMLQSPLCFAEYDLTYTIDEHLDGDWTNLVLPPGLLAIGLFLASLVLLQIFIVWAKRCAAQMMAATAAGTPYEKLAES